MPFKHHKRCAPSKKPKTHIVYTKKNDIQDTSRWSRPPKQPKSRTQTYTNVDSRVKQHPAARPPGATLLRHKTHLKECSKKNLWALFFFFRCENHRLVLVPWPTARLFLVFDFVACLSFYMGEKYRTLAWRLGHLHFFPCSRGLTATDALSSPVLHVHTQHSPSSSTPRKPTVPPPSKKARLSQSLLVDHLTDYSSL